MSNFVIKNGEISIPRSVYIKSLVFLGLVVLSIVVMQPIQAAVISGIQKIRSGLIERIEELSNLELRYSSLRPSIFGSFDIRDLQLLKDNESMLSVSHIKMKFSLLELLFKKKTFIHSVTFDRPVFNIDTQKDKDTLEYLISLIRTDDTFTEIMEKISGFFPRDADFLIRQCSINLKDKNTVYNVKDMNLNLWGNDKNDILLAGRFNAEITINDFLKKTFVINTDIGIDALTFDNMKNGDIDIILYNLLCSAADAREDKKVIAALPMFSANPVNFKINYKENLISSNSSDDEQNFSYAFLFNADNGDLSANLKFNDFLLGDKISVTDNWKNALHLLKVQLSGEAFYKYENDKMDYKIILAGSNIDNQASDSLLIDINGDENLLSVNDVRLNLSSQTAKAGFFQGGVNIAGNVQYEPLKPSGRIVLDRFSLTGDEYGRDSITAVLNVSSSDKEIRITSGRASVAQSQLNNLNLILYPSKRETALSFSTSFANTGKVSLDAVYSGNPQEMEASMIMDSVSFYDISEIFRPFVNYARFPANNVLNNYLVSTEVFFSTDFENTVFNAPNIVFDFDGSPGMISITATDSQFNLSNGLFYLNDEEFLVSGNVLYVNPMELVFSLNANYQDLSWNVDGQLFDKTTLILSDPNGLDVYVSLLNNNAVSGYIEGKDFSVYLKNEKVYLDFFINLRYNSPDFWDLSVDHITARGQNSSDGNEFFKISGIADQNGASFRNIIFNDPVGILVGNADFSWEPDFSYTDFIIYFTDGQPFGESYNMEGFIQNEHINVNASVANMHLNRFIRDSAPMLVSAKADVAWDSIDSFNANINISKINSVIPNDYIRGSVDININNEELLINNLVMDIAGLKTILPALQINRSDGRATAEAYLQGIAWDRNLEGNVNIDINFSQLNSWLEINNALNYFNGTVKIDNIIYNKKEQDPFVFVFSREDSAISVSGGIKDMIRLDMDSAGNFYAGLSAPFPIRGSLIGTFKQGIIDVSCNNFYFDMGLLWSLISRVPEFNIKTGYLTGAVQIRGPIWNPEFYGNARGSSFCFQVPNFISEDIRVVPFNILAEGYEMTFGPVVLACGEGSGTVNGWFLFERWAPVNIGLDVLIPRDMPVPYDMNIVGFLAKGTASGNFNLKLDQINAITEYSGDLFTNEAELGLNVEDLTNQANIIDMENIKIYSLLNFKVTLGSTIEFVWPVTTPILRAKPEMGTVVNISSDNRAGQFSLISDVKIRSGEVYYFDRSFYIRNGNLIFRENEARFDPRFTARAEIRDRSDNGNVTISMVVENEPLFNFVPRFEANPTLSQLEIYSILGQNVNSIQDAESHEAAQRLLIASTTDILTQVVATTDVFSQFAFMRRFERLVRDFFKLDMFSVRTKFLQNAIVTGASGFQQDPYIIGRSSRVGNYFDNTTVFIGKYIGQEMFVQGMATLRYDENSNVFGGLKLELDIGIELQSPFINIRWDFYPYHPENWWVSDNSITLSWSKSF